VRLASVPAEAGVSTSPSGASSANSTRPGVGHSRNTLACIVGNLLDNAEKYGRQSGDRTISLAARRRPPSVEVVVSDHGPGIAPQARVPLFQPFACGVSADGSPGLGLGLGLAQSQSQSQSLARAMGGDLAYHPAPTGGAAFVLTLARE
jgi:C4-dicarboxylate-specific signal transduction histidine kinase